MDQALLEAQVRYLTGCYVTDALRDEEGRIAGVVTANRSGRQAIRAKVVVDATRQAVVARKTATQFRRFVPGPQTVTRVVVGGILLSGHNILSCEKKGFTYDSVAKGTRYQLPVYEYTLRIKMAAGGCRFLVHAENEARDMTYSQGSEMGAEVLSSRAVRYDDWATASGHVARHGESGPRVESAQGHSSPVCFGERMQI